MEVYTDSEIIFMMPLSKQDKFFVSEFQEEEMSVATTDMTGSVMAGPAETEARADRDKDGFLIPLSHQSENMGKVKRQYKVLAGFSRNNTSSNPTIPFNWFGSVMIGNLYRSI